MGQWGEHKGTNRGELEAEIRSRTQSSVLLIGSASVGSTGLRTVIQESGALRLIAEIANHPAAVAVTRRHQPNHILMAADGLAGAEILLLRELRGESPASTLVVCTDCFDRETLVALEQIPVEGILAWPDVTTTALHETLYLTARGTRVMSALAVDALLGDTKDITGNRPLTETERAIVRGLDAELTETEIAETASLSLRTVRRTVKSLKNRLGVHTLYQVGRMVERVRLFE